MHLKAKKCAIYVAFNIGEKGEFIGFNVSIKLYVD